MSSHRSLNSNEEASRSFIVLHATQFPRLIVPNILLCYFEFNLGEIGEKEYQRGDARYVSGIGKFLACCNLLSFNYVGYVESGNLIQ